MFVGMSNVYAMGGYSIEAKVGSEAVSVRLILDSGSSTLVVTEQAWSPTDDSALLPTRFVQDVTYGIGGWAGPLVQTQLTLTSLRAQISLNTVPVAMASVSQPNCFFEADGFLGLAYHHLDKSYDVSLLLADLDPPASVTWPWPFDVQPDPDSLHAFKHQIAQQPEVDVEPYFDDLTEHGLISNCFGFLSRRSSIHHPKPDMSSAELDGDPLNRGMLILGEDARHNDLYQGTFQTVDVNHDVYYNVQLIAAGVDGMPLCLAPPLDARHQPTYFSNAIIDTGASMLVMVASLFDQLHADLIACNPSFEALIEPFLKFTGTEIGIDRQRVTVEEWPDLILQFADHDQQPVTLRCRPETYWQDHAPEHGQISFKLLSQIQGWPDQSIIGLPLLNNYYVLFDRELDQTGAVCFAAPV